MMDAKEYAQAQKKMRDFVATKEFSTLFINLIEIVEQLKQEDIDKLGEPKETENGKALRFALKTLTDNGFFQVLEVKELIFGLVKKQILKPVLLQVKYLALKFRIYSSFSIIWDFLNLKRV